MASGEKLEPVTSEDMAEPYSAWRYTHYLRCMPHGSGWLDETETMLETLTAFEIGFIELKAFLEYRNAKKNRK